MAIESKAGSIFNLTKDVHIKQDNSAARKITVFFYTRIHGVLWDDWLNLS